MTVRFADFTFDSAQRDLLRRGKRVHLSRKAFDILALLIARRPAVIGKRELLDEIWEGRAVEEENIKNLIAELRRALEDSSETPRFIRTVHGIGYAFCGDSSCEPSTWAILWEGRTIPLARELVIGRATTCDVLLHAKSASRQHARVSLTDSRPSIDDLGSTNGTFVNGERIEGSKALQSGDVISIGSESMTIVEADQSTTAAMVSPQK